MKVMLISVALLLVAGCSRYGFSEFIGAVRRGDVAQVRSALDKGTDPNQRGGVNHWTALLHAIHTNQPASVHLLLEAGADANATADAGITPLIMAAGYGFANVVEDLLAHGANAQQTDSRGFGPLDAAVGGVAGIDRFTVGNCQGATVKALLARAPGVKLRDETAARIAKFSGCEEVLGLLAHR